MRAIQIAKTGGPEVLELVELARPEPTAGQALVKIQAAGINFIDTYLREGRPACNDRHVFLTVRAPFRPLMYWDVSQRAAWHLRKSGVRIPRAGSHTLRHSCVQRLVEADVPFKVIGDYIGHRTDVATQIYAKVAVHTLRPLAVGAAEDIL